MVDFPFFSVVVPTYNSLKTLQQTIAGLLSQNYPSDRYEIIIIDDGSTDGTTDYLKQMMRQGHLFFQPQTHKGPGGARNHGARLGHGEILAFIDHDCLPERDWLAYMAESYSRPDTVWVDAVGGRIENISQGHWLYEFQTLRSIHHIANKQEYPSYLDTANASYRRQVFLAVDGFNENLPWSEDVELGFRLQDAGYRLATNPRAVVWHVGTTSLEAYFRRSYQIGRGTAMLMIMYPAHFAGLPSHGLRLFIKRLLDRLVSHANQSPRLTRTLACLLACGLRRLIYDMVGEEIFFRSYLPGQFWRFRASRLGWSKIGSYLLLEWFWHLAHLWGQFTQTLRYTYQRVAIGQTVS
jgi:cellulose synthase/poly-beta-1,6-N-acetylglucosamine synthase-like glycosyltransferase